MLRLANTRSGSAFSKQYLISLAYFGNGRLVKVTPRQTAIGYRELYSGRRLYFEACSHFTVLVVAIWGLFQFDVFMVKLYGLDWDAFARYQKFVSYSQWN